MTSADGSDLMDLHKKGFLGHPPVPPSRAGLPGARAPPESWGRALLGRSAALGNRSQLTLTLCRSYTIRFCTETTEVWCVHDSQLKVDEKTRGKMET